MNRPTSPTHAKGKELAPQTPGTVNADRIPANLERRIVLGAMMCYEFYLLLRERICPFDPEKRLYRSDFLLPQFNELYAFIDTYWKNYDATAPASHEQSIPPETLKAYATDSVNASLLSADSAAIITATIDDSASLAAELTTPALLALLASDEFEHWRGKRHIDKSLAEIALLRQSGLATPEKCAELLQRTLDGMSAANNQMVFEDGADFLAADIPEPQLIIEGMLRRGEILIFNGGSKAKKTWSALMMASCVVGQKPFWNRQTVKGRVCYINFELSRWTCQRRLRAVSAELGVTVVPGDIDLVNMRGLKKSPEEIIRRLSQEIRQRGYSLIIIDPFYRLLDGRAENSNEQMIELLEKFGVLASQTDCAFWINHHFSKGNQAFRDSIDRGSGAGALARFPDTLISMTAHEVDDAFVIESTPRDFETAKKIVVEWRYPLLVVNPDLDPEKLKQAKNSRQIASDYQLLRSLSLGLEGKWASVEEWLAALSTAGCALAPQTLRNRAAELVKAGKVESKKDGKCNLYRPKISSNPKIPIGNVHFSDATR
jgi:AAA domain